MHLKRSRACAPRSCRVRSRGWFHQQTLGPGAGRWNPIDTGGIVSPFACAKMRLAGYRPAEFKLGLFDEPCLDRQGFSLVLKFGVGV